MAIPPTSPNQYFTPTFGPDMPQEIATHFRQLYLSAGQHDQAIKLVHTMASTSTTIVRTVSTGGSTGTVIIPGNTPAIAHEAIVSYDASNGMFGQLQFDFVDLTGIAAVAQGGTGTAIPSLVAGTNTSVSGTFPNQSVNTVGLSITIVTAALTVGGTQGSMTFVSGILTAAIAAT